MPAGRNFGGNVDPGFDAPASGHFAITPHDTDEVAHETRAIYVGVTGDVKITAREGTVTYKAVPAGSVIPIRALIVFAIGTTATDLVGMY